MFRIVCLVFVCALPATASMLTTFAEVDPGTGIVQQSGSTSSSVSLTGVSGPSLGSFFNGSASSSASFGALKAQVSVEGSDYQPGTYSAPGCTTYTCTYYDLGAANATFTDTFTITGGTGQGYLVLTAQIDGNGTGSGQAGLYLFSSPSLADPLPYGDFDLGFGSYDDFAINETLTNDPAKSSVFGGAYSEQQAIPFTFGQPIYITLDLVASTTIDDSFVTLPYSFSDSANLGDTASVTGLQVYSDPSLQNPVTGFTVQTDSGTVYATSEPGSALLLLSALSAIGLFYCRRRLMGDN